jgi:hypothetical protein
MTQILQRLSTLFINAENQKEKILLLEKIDKLKN